jgi:hypothetical protein
LRPWQQKGLFREGWMKGRLNLLVEKLIHIGFALNVFQASHIWRMGPDLNTNIVNVRGLSLDKIETGSEKLID